MKEIVGDFWQQPGAHVIPTGSDVDAHACVVLRSPLLKEAARRSVTFPLLYADVLTDEPEKFATHLYIHSSHHEDRLHFLVPYPLVAPHCATADLARVERLCRLLAFHTTGLLQVCGEINLPPLWDEPGLAEAPVRALFTQYLDADHFVLVVPEGTAQ